MISYQPIGSPTEVRWGRYRKTSCSITYAARRYAYDPPILNR